MTQEDKKLLLADLCARLPYAVNVKTTGDNESYILLSINSNKNIALIGLNFDGVYATSKIKIDEVKPYLRPMSSMTEVERHIFDTMTRGYTVHQQSNLFDWLNAHHFDYRSLIGKKGLAIEAPEGMYGKEEQQ